MGKTGSGVLMDTVLMVVDPLNKMIGDKKTIDVNFLMAKFTKVSGQRGKTLIWRRSSPIRENKKLGSLTSIGIIASTTGLASQISSGVSGSGILNARLGSATSAGLLALMVSVSSWKVGVTWGNLQKVAASLLEFATDDMTRGSYMSSQSLLGRFFQMSNKIKPPILSKLLKCIHLLSIDTHCLENLQ